MFYQAYQRATGGSGATRRNPVLLGWLARALRFLARDIRGMVLKDIRVFLRDPMQWSQALIFFGLLGLYFSSLRSFHYHYLPDAWKNLVAFLNVFSVSAVLCSLASRFIFPQLSLEGHAFWILGLSPTTPGRILVTKFFLSLSGVLTVSLVLMGLSCRMLQLDLTVRLVSLAVTAAISCAVCALSTGLGAVFLNLKQSNPVVIVSGFGGTVNLVLSLGFMLAAIVPFGLLFHLVTVELVDPAVLRRGLVLASAWLACITAAATVVPLWLGRRSLATRDY
jgi:ABC-2 type transport system permease protein